MRTNRAYLAAAAYVVMIMTGIGATTFGAALPEIRETLRLTISQTGTLIVAKTVGYILGSLSASFVIERVGKKIIGCAGAVMYGTSLLLFGVFPGLWINFALYMLLGLGSGYAQLVANSLIIELYDEKRSNMMSILHFFFTLGSVAGPVVVGLLYRRGLSWRWAFVTYSAIALTLFWMFAVVRFPERADGDGRGTRVSSFRLLREPVVLILVLLMGSYVTVQIGVGNWLTSYLEQYISLPLVLSSNILAVYWVGMALGRLLCFRISHRVGHRVLLLVMSLGASLFLIFSILASSPAALLVLAGLLGLSLSGFYPIVMAMGGSLYRARAGAVAGIIAGGASLSASLLQWTMAQISDASTIRVGMVFYAAVAAASIVTTLAAIRLVRRAGYVDD